MFTDLPLSLSQSLPRMPCVVVCGFLAGYLGGRVGWDRGIILGSEHVTAVLLLRRPWWVSVLPYHSLLLECPGDIQGSPPFRSQNFTGRVDCATSLREGDSGNKAGQLRGSGTEMFSISTAVEMMEPGLHPEARSSAGWVPLLHVTHTASASGEIPFRIPSHLSCFTPEEVVLAWACPKLFRAVKVATTSWNCRQR